MSVFRVQTIIEERPCNSYSHHVDLWVDGVRFSTTCNSAGDAYRIVQATLRALGLKP